MTYAKLAQICLADFYYLLIVVKQNKDEVKTIAS